MASLIPVGICPMSIGPLGILPSPPLAPLTLTIPPLVVMVRMMLKLTMTAIFGSVRMGIVLTPRPQAAAVIRVRTQGKRMEIPRKTTPTIPRMGT
jgi:hypothetical protein